ncbi:hypothetical protein SERLA73DRAFT_55912, partial [Serpula lacrymans var. lacrymans S7.3]
VIKAAFTEKMAKHFHLVPFKCLWMSISPPDNVPPEKYEYNGHIYDELYTSDAWIREHDNLQKQPPEPECNLKRVIAGLMFWSDSTHLADFGCAKAWPLYLYFGNLSKYLCAKSQTDACHHVAYIPSLPDSVREFVASFSKVTKNSVPLWAHCRRGLMHEVWRVLLDNEFCHAYQHGIVIQCIDGIFR